MFLEAYKVHQIPSPVSISDNINTIILSETMFPLSLSILAAIAITPVTSVLQRDPNYLYATFRATNQLKTSETDTLDIYSSTNGVNFTTYHVPASVPSSQGKNPSLIRDPSITHFNGKYYVAHTTGWTGNNFNIMTSDDLKTWTDYTTVSFNESNFDVGYAVGAVWAPVSISIPAQYEHGTQTHKPLHSTGILLGPRPQPNQPINHSQHPTSLPTRRIRPSLRQPLPLETIHPSIH